jgi:hypothetical protein
MVWFVLLGSIEPTWHMLAKSLVPLLWWHSITEITKYDLNVRPRYCSNFFLSLHHSVTVHGGPNRTNYKLSTQQLIIMTVGGG